MLASLEKTYRTWEDQLYALALAITKDADSAHDSIQDALVGVLTSKRPVLRMKPYLFRAVKNAALNRRSAQRRLVPMDENQGAGIEDESRIWTTDRVLDKALAALQEKQRISIVLKIRAGMTFKEIGSVCGWPTATAASHYQRGIKLLKESFKDED